MKKLMTLGLVALALGCSKDGVELAPCDRAKENVARLRGDVKEQDPLFTAERCRAAALSREELNCLGYASSWEEARACSPRAFADDVSTR